MMTEALLKSVCPWIGLKQLIWIEKKMTPLSLFIFHNLETVYGHFVPVTSSAIFIMLMAADMKVQQIVSLKMLGTVSLHIWG